MPRWRATSRQRRATVEKSAHLRGPVDGEDLLAVDGHVPRVGEELGHVVDELLGRYPVVVLGEQHILGVAVPPAGPVLVGPHDAEREVEVAADERLDRPVEQALPGEPVVVVHEALDAGRGRHLRLRPPHVVRAEVVEAQVGGQPRLVVAVEHRLRRGHVGPLREPLAPPLVVLGRRVELRQVERHEPGARMQRPAVEVFVQRRVSRLRERRPLDRAQPRLGGEYPDQPLDRVRGGAVDLALLVLEVRRRHRQRAEALQHDAATPVHRPGSEGQGVVVQRRTPADGPARARCAGCRPRTPHPGRSRRR